MQLLLYYRSHEITTFIIYLPAVKEKSSLDTSSTGSAIAHKFFSDPNTEVKRKTRGACAPVHLKPEYLLFSTPTSTKTEGYTHEYKGKSIITHLTIDPEGRREIVVDASKESG